MTTFLWVLVVLFALSALGHLLILAKGSIAKPMTPGQRVANILISITLLVWVAILLAGQQAPGV